MMESRNLKELLRGMAGGLPIALGYAAVSFSLGILMRNAGLDPVHGLIMSLVNNTSAGEAAALGIIASGGGYIELALSQLVINLRYALMAAALSLHLSSTLSLPRRALVGFDITDEVFALLVSQPRPVSEFYAYGIALVTIPCWAAGSALGIIFGDILPSSLVSALSVALYAMFVAVVIPPARRQWRILVLVIVSMAASWLVDSVMTSGVKTIVLTVAISALAAIVWPVEEL